MLQNGFGLKKGEVYYQNADLLFNHIYIGAGDRFSFGVGMMPIFLLEPGTYPYTVSLKFATPVSERNIHAALCFFHWGTQYAGADYSPGSWESLLATAYGVVTLGNRWRNVSFMGGAYTGFYDMYIRRNSTGFYPGRPRPEYYSPMCGIGAKLGGSGQLAFVTDNYWFRYDGLDYLVVSGGIRFLGRRFHFDFSIALGNEFYGDGEPEYYPVPWLSTFFPIGKTARGTWRREN